MGFLVVAVLSALLTATVTFRQARGAILERSQEAAVNDLRTQVDSLGPDLVVPPQEEDLRDFALRLEQAGGSHPWRVSVSYADGPIIPGPPKGEQGSALASLRAAVGDRRSTVYQRVDRDGDPRLVIAMPVDFADGGTPSGVVVYADMSLSDERDDIAALVTAAQVGAVPALVLALVPALIAARRVLLPVRRLQEAAERITSGELDTRLPVSGSDELADLTRTFNTMAAALESSDTELRRMEANARRFAADVSHELRTPLSAMTAVTGVLDEEVERLDPDTADAVQLISQETAKLARMVEDLMEISRFDAGAAALQLDEVDVATAVRKTLRLRGWDDQVEAELPEGLRARLDPRRIDVVLANLISNALRHGGAPVRLRAWAEGGRLLIDVADDGPGIDPEALPHVFDRFYKADAARARSEGSGLGLAIAMENTRLHHGTLTAANAPEGGAVFTVSLPVDPDEGGGREGAPDGAGRRDGSDGPADPGGMSGGPM
ncbi:sensor histidine kinase [Nocardiopsis gilva YIM 90087]|uniref:Signal transduction histidine-protein kinase/phosphatase MprB n=1 Tax=Nocardiopsis gilva YIM 90087 TaxID=1235441 RepID=A0A223S1F3_9ACTN|nr:sensor histidine kinase [Nocardiopsis gilva YIM 90087]